MTAEELRFVAREITEAIKSSERELTVEEVLKRVVRLLEKVLSAKERETMIVEERVADFLRENRGKDFCDDCITFRAGADKRHVCNTTSTLGVTRDFNLSQGQCSECGKNKKVIHAT